MRNSLRLLLFGIVIASLPGCAWDITNRNDPGLAVDLSKHATAEPVISPLNNERYWNGEPMDLRRNR